MPKRKEFDVVDDDLQGDTIYEREVRHHLVEDGELSPSEDAFMQGYMEADDEPSEEDDWLEAG